MRLRLSLAFLFMTFVIAFVANAYGMNRIVLNQSDSNGGKNLLKQEMFYKLENGERIPNTNTIFVIQSDFDLAEDITIPSGCILEFEGGSLRKGKINTNGCYIDAGLYQVFEGIEFNSIITYDGQLKATDNIYIKVLAGYSFVNKKTNTLIPANSIVNRRYTDRITGKGTSFLKEGNSAITSINGQKYKIADITSDGSYRLRYDYTRVIGIYNKTGEMASGIVKSLKGITFYSIEPLSYATNSFVKNKEIHPEWFGAKGDNKNDDSEAFNTALDLAYFSDSKVVIGNGVYRIDDALVIHTHTNLAGIVPTVEHPVRGCFSVNTDVGMLIFDKFNPSGSYILDNFGFIPYSNDNSSNYVGIKIYHSQNHARISNIGFYCPKTGIEIDAIGGVQMLRCEDISMRGDKNKEVKAIVSTNRLGGWFNSNYFRFACVGSSGGVKFEGGGDNILDGGAGYVESPTDFLINLSNQATLIVKGGLYKETGRIAKLSDSSKLIIEGDSFIIGEVICDETSYVYYPSRNLQSRQTVLNNTITYNNVVLAHYKVFTKNSKLWYETINKRIVKPVELESNYHIHQYNGRLFTSGKCKLPMENIDITGKTIVFRVISPAPYTESQRYYPFTLNADIKHKSTVLSQRRSMGFDNTSILYAPGEMNLGAIEKGERFVFMPSHYEDNILRNIAVNGNSTLLVSDIYIIDKDSKDIVENERLRIIDIMCGLDSFVQEDGLLLGYNKGSSSERPTYLSSDDEGFEYYDTTLNKPIYWTGDILIGDKGWVDVMGNHPGR